MGSKRRSKRSRRKKNQNKFLIVLLLIVSVSVIGLHQSGLLSIYAGGYEFNSVIDTVAITPIKYAGGNETGYTYVSTFGTTMVNYDPDGKVQLIGSQYYGALPSISIYESNFFSMMNNGSISSEIHPYKNRTVTIENYTLVEHYFHLGYDLMIRTKAYYVDGFGPTAGYYEGALFTINVRMKVFFSGEQVRILGQNSTGWAGILSISVMSFDSGLTQNTTVLPGSQPYEVSDFPVEGAALPMYVDNDSFTEYPDGNASLVNIPSTVYYNVTGDMRVGGYTPIGNPTITYDVYAKFRILVDVVTLNNYVPSVSEGNGLGNPEDNIRWAVGLFDAISINSFPVIVVVLIVFVIIYVFYKESKPKYIATPYGWRRI